MVGVLHVSPMIKDVGPPFICSLQATVNALTEHWEGLLTDLTVLLGASLISPAQYICSEWCS